MIQKMSKKNVVQIPVNMNINIPTPAIYAMLSEGMEEEDLNQEIIDVALEQIDINNLQDYVKQHIETFLNEYYSN
jgi:AAA+ superfamily predicted ATPase